MSAFFVIGTDTTNDCEAMEKVYPYFGLNAEQGQGCYKFEDGRVQVEICFKVPDLPAQVFDYMRTTKQESVLYVNDNGVASLFYIDKAECLGHWQVLPADTDKPDCYSIFNGKVYVCA